MLLGPARVTRRRAACRKTAFLRRDDVFAAWHTPCSKRRVMSERRAFSGLLRCLSLATLLCVALVGRTAIAQTVTVGAVVERDALRSSALTPYGLSYKDCTEGNDYTFTVTLAGFSGLLLEVWAGSVDCTLSAQRQGDAAGCWQVRAGEAVSDAILTVRLRSQDIISGHKGVALPTGQQPGTPKDCENNAAGESGPHALTLYFMLVDAGVALGTAGTYAVNYDLAGPTPPTGVTAGVGEQRLIVQFTGSTSSDRKRYRFYCDPPAGAIDGGTTDAGTGGTGGSTDAGTAGTATDAGDATAEAAAAVEAGSSGAGCPTAALIAGEKPNEDYFCGEVTSATTDQGEAIGLKDGVSYAVAVAGVDGYGNVGTLSNVACGTPQPVDDFFERYREANGQGGGGFCGVVRRPTPEAAMIVVGAVLALALRRRRSP